ncbi:MAG: peptidoglycan DD-metalloendopeptidase family protein [Patescibacteria group bacterium]
MQSINYKKNLLQIFIFVLFSGYFLIISFLNVSDVSAETVEQLRKKIQERNQQIEQIQKEIEKYQKQLDQTLEEKTTLKNEISRLEITQKKLISDINLTQKQIESTGFNIERLEIEIADKQNSITGKKGELSEIIRSLNEAESQSLVEITLANDTLSDFFTDIERMENFQKELNINLKELKELKSFLEEEKAEREIEKQNFEDLKGKLVDQKIIVDSTKKQKNQILTLTKNKEENYKKILADRVTKQKALEDEIRSIEEQIRVVIDPSSLPRAGSGVLKWPLDSIMITQYFGNTPFATQNPQVYNGQGHNGIDLRASIGTPVKAAGDGTITAIGDTDQSCYGVSFGKWILISHPNNLSTLYAHLSLIRVSIGQSVKAGNIIGYAGTTGYTTGPHLHFSVYATPGVKIDQIRSKICGTMMTLPVASFNSYLNPLSYL